MPAPRILCMYIAQDTMCPEAASGLETLQVPVIRHVLQNPNGTHVRFDPVQLLASALQNQVSWVFFTNTFGVDPEGRLLRALAMAGIRSAAWFIDNPFYFQPHLEALKSIPSLECFVWDQWYVPHLSRYGFARVHHLPQATNPERFHPMELNTTDRNRFECPLSFAANLDYDRLVVQIQELETHYPEAVPFWRPLLMQASLRAVANPETAPWELLQELQPEVVPECPVLPLLYYFQLARILEERLSILYREELVAALGDHKIALWGSVQQQGRHHPGVTAKGRASYFIDMPKVYNGSAINLNLSRLQQRHGTNQRVFDVPACRAFLLTDYRKELEDYFEPGKDCVIYRNFQELKNLLHRYQDEGLRRQVACLAYEKTVNTHTYAHRMKQFLEVIEALPASAPADFDWLAASWLTEAYFASNRHDEALSLMAKLAPQASRHPQIFERLRGLAVK